MEEPMSNKTIKYEVKLQKSVIVILGILAVGVGAIAFAPVFSVKNADAAFGVGSEMIQAGPNRDGIWQLKDGKVRKCGIIESFPKPPTCSVWSN
jgi:hypothetical protein